MSDPARSQQWLEHLQLLVRPQWQLPNPQPRCRSLLRPANGRVPIGQNPLVGGMRWILWWTAWGRSLDLKDGQISEWCEVDGSFFNSDAIPIIFGKFLEKLNITIVAIIFLDHREQLFFDYFANFRTYYFGIIHWLSGIIRKEVILETRCSVTSWLCTTG